MEQTQKLKKYDFEKALKSGYSKSQIVNSLRNNYDTNLDWEKINEALKELKPKERDEAVFDSLYNNQEIWGISGIKIKEQPKGLQNRILSDNQIQHIEKEVQNMPQWAIESALKPQILRETLNVDGFWKMFQNKEEIARENALKNALDKGITQKLEKGEDLSVGEILRYYNANDMQKHFTPQSHYKEQQELKKIAQTDFENLDESQKRMLQKQNLITRLWNSHKELHDKLKDEVTKRETDEHTKARAEQLERDIINIQRTYENILKSGADYLRGSTEQRDKYKEMLQESAISLGFDGIGFKGDRIYAFKGDRAIFIDDGFFENLGQILGTNTFDIAGSITGAIAGAKRGTGKIGKLAGAIAGGAVGAGLGGIADSIIAQYNSRGEFNLADALLTGAESATFDIAGGLIVSGGAKAVKGAVKGTQYLLRWNPFSIPTSAVINSFGSENIQVAKELVEQTFTQEQKDDILSFSKSFGGNLELQGKETFLTKSAEFLTQKYGADSKIAKVANALEDYSKAHNKAQAREDILTLIRADEKGQTLGILIEVAKNSILANQNLREILNATSYKLKKEIEGLGLRENAFKKVFNDFQKGTQEDYDEAFNKILGELYEGEKVVLDGEAYAKFREKMGDLILLDPQGMQFLNFVEKGIYNPNGVDFTQLSNARKLLNSYRKIATNPSTQDFINNAIESTLREDIDKGVNQIFLSRPEQFEKAKKLYDTTLSDYSAMLNTMDVLSELDFNKLSKTNAELMDKLIQFTLGSGGRKEVNNYELLTKGLKKEQIESLELNALNRIYEKNLLKNKMDSTFEVFDSKQFLEDTAKLREIFQSEGAQKFIEIMQGFNRLFGNDATIALKLEFANPPKEGSAIAQSVEGAIQQKIVKGIFGILMRNLPTSNKLVDIFGFKERVQKMALAHHIEQALKSAYSINDFNFALKKISDDPSTPSPTRQVINEFIKDLSRLVEEVRENADIDKTAQALKEYEQDKNTSLKDTIQILKDKRRQELQRAIQEKMEKHALESQILKEAQQEKQRIKDAQVGKAINEVDLNLQGAIQARALKPTRINLENKSYPAQFVVINKEDLKPNFNTTGTQGRTQKQENVIQDIQENLNPNKLFFSEGGFEGLPIILKDGQVSVGNHRAQALKNLSQESLAAYQKSAKEVFGVDLKENELIVRMLDERIPNNEILNLSFASNVGREQNISEKALSTLGKYQENLDKLPQNIYAQSVEEMQQIVAKSLDKTNNGLNTFDTNLALLTSLCRSQNKNILESLSAIKGSAEEKQAALRMFVENAGNFHNLAKQTQMPNIDLRPYLNQTIFFTASAKESRMQNFQELINEIDSLIKTTDSQGKNAMLEQNPSYYEDLIGKILGYSFARFKELENPSKAMFEFLNNIQSTLRQELEPTLFSAGRPLSSADIYDFLSVSIKSGIPSDETSKLLDLLPQLKQKQEAFKVANTNTQRNGNGNHHNGNNDNSNSNSGNNANEAALQGSDSNANGVLVGTYERGAEAKAQNAESKISKNISTQADSLQTQGITEEIKQLIDTSAQKGRDMQVIGKENFTPEIVQYVQEQNKKVAIEKLSQEEAQHLGFKYPQDVRVTIDSSAINHTLNRHGAESNLAQKSGQEAVDYSDIAKYREYAKGADETLRSVDNGGSNVLVSYKQVNGHFVVVEQIKHKNNELGFKTLFKEKGNYKDSKSYKDTIAKAQTLSIGYEPSANSFALAKSLNSTDIIPQNRTLQNTSLDNLTQEIAQLNKQAGELNKRYHQAKDITEKRRLESEYTKTLDKIYSLRAQHPDEIIDVEFIAKEPDITKRIEYKRHNQRAKQIQEINTQLEQIDKEATSNLLNGDALENLINRYKLLESKKAKLREKQLQVRGNTLPTYKPDEIIDVEIIQAEPSIQKQITYKRHNLRAKAIQSLQVKLEALKPYPQKQIEYKRLESQIHTLVEKQHKELRQPSLFSEEDLGKNPQNSIIQNKTTKGEEYGTADSNKSGEISTRDNQLARIGDDDFKQNQGEIQLEGRNREQGEANRQHTQTIPQKSTKQDSSGGGMGGKPSISSNRSGGLQENPRSNRLGQNRNPRSRECLFVANGKRGVGSTKSTSRGFGNATENLRVSDRLADNIQSTDNPQGLLSPEQKAEVNQKYKPAEIIETGNAKQIVKHNLKAIQTLAELLENNALATNEQKDLLHNFRGFGKASNEMLEIMRNPQNKTAQEFKAALQKINEIAGTKLDLIQIIRTFADSYYTPQPIVRQMVGLLKDRIANLPSFNVLEPSVGVGRFLGELPSNANIYAVERDELSALLAKNIYPHAKIETSDFQKSNIANIENAFDLVIGNPPYSSTILRDQKGISGTAHNYFLQKSIKSLHPNGISIQIVTHNFLDSNNSKYRELISKEAKFLGAVRLPSGTFKDTEVVTDIVAFRKLSEGESAEDLWVKSSKTDENVFINDYFKRNPHHILGETKVVKNQFGNETLQVSNPNFDINSFDLGKYIPLDEQSLKGYTLGDEIIKPTENVSTQRAVGEVTIQNGKFYKYLNNKAGSQIEFNPHQMLSEITTWSESTIKKAVENYQNDFPKIQTLKSELENLRYLENSMAEDAEIESARARLNAAYDDLLKGYSFKNESGGFRERFRAFVMLDDTAFELLALEKGILTKEVNGKTKIIGSQKADIFTQRQIYPYKPPLSAQNLNDAVTIAKNETGKIDIQRINTLLERGEDELQKTQEELLNEKFLFLDFKGEIVEKVDFLSGNVKQKLQSFKDESGEVRFSEDEKKAKFQKIAYESLKEVQPIDIDIADVTIPLGANWIPKEIHEQFLQELGMREISLQYEPQIGWLAKGIGHNNNEYIINTSKEFRDATGVREINALNYIEKMFNNNELLVQRVVTKGETTHTYKDPIATRALQNAKVRLQKEFKSFIVDREDLLQDTQKRFNDLFNAEVPKTYDGSHLSFIGMNRNIHLRPHQKNAVYRILTSSNTLLAHAVGTGKTYTLASSVMEANRLGQARKSMIVLPNYLTTQFAIEARQLYPNAKIAVVNGINKRLKNRQLEQLKNNQYDLIVTTYTAFKEMDISRDYFQRIINEEVYDAERLLAKLQEEKAPKRRIKGLVDRIDKLRQKAILREEKLKKEGVNVFFDDLGLDGLYFDEAHYLKSLPITTRQPNVRGINTRESERAMDALMKIRQMQDFSKKVVFSTGTPVTNYVSDIYIMQKYLSPNKLKERGVERFDDWCSMFAEASTEFELKPTGDYAETTRLRRITNLIELNKMYFDFTDLITKEEMKEAMENMGIKNVEPKVTRKQSVNELSKGQIKYLEEVYHRAEELKRNPESAFMKGGDNHLKIINDARKASLDLRLVNPNAPRDEKSKVVQCANNIKEIYDRYNEDLGTQLVFLDLSTPKRTLSPAKRAKITKEYEQIMESIELGRATSAEEAEKLQAKAQSLGELLEMSGNSFSLYDELKTLLKERGIKEDEIAFIHDYDAKKGAFSKEALSDKINSGKIRILIGSTGKMGAGCNFQERLVALHHLDLDWTPANMEQREGRIIRQGNKLLGKYGENFEVEIHNYITKNSSDSIMLQTLENKQRIIKQMQDKTLRVREVVDDSEDDIYGMLQALGSENGEEMLEMLKLGKNINLITNELESFDTKLKSTTAQLSFAKTNIKNLETQKSLLQSLEKMPLESLNIQGKEYLLSGEKTREKFNQALSAQVDKFSNSIDNVGEIATIGEYKILAKKDSKYIIFRIGKDLKENVGLFHFEVNNRATTDYYRRFLKEFKEIAKGEAKKAIDIKIQSAHATQQRHEKTLKKLNSEDRQNLETKLNAHKARYKELEDIIKAKEIKGNESPNQSNTPTRTKLQTNPHLGSGIVGGSVAGFETDEQGNLNFNPANFLLGLAGGAVGSKAVALGFKTIEKNPELKAKVTKELADTLSKGWDSATKAYPILSTLEPRHIIAKSEKGRDLQAKHILREVERKEAKGLYSVAYNGKNATRVFKDLRAVEEAIRFTQGYHKATQSKGKGAKHIRIKHLSDESKEGYVKPIEVANLGKDLRSFLKDYEPFEEVQKSGQKANIYEWENKEGVRFRLVVGENLSGGTTAHSHQNLPNEEIITFYSDRNLKNKMEFKNPALTQTTLKASLESKKAQRRAELESKIAKRGF
ncbi:DEAD/DEAH box helicase family protein [uncultured Helicobacter sp.]|uniref:PBECR3 domain-containing polyvalent protein n=1 Tax=uncultured Helicobacter sp. TaxID=175537 RepID=UPI00261E65C0|nr:DEAD/DEAH box helicase family protein [uncultured Helicobacter sp.]